MDGLTRTPRSNHPHSLEEHMTGQELRNLQAPLKQQYTDRPDSARVTLKAQARLGQGITCKDS